MKNVACRVLAVVMVFVMMAPMVGFAVEMEDVTRAEFVTMLGRLHEYGNETIGVPGVGAFYERYLVWAVEMGIMHGDENGDLMPQAFITREQMAVVVYRYIEVFGLWGYFQSDFGSTMAMFWDVIDISLWARSPVEILRLHSIVRGNISYFRPQDHLSRAEAIVMFVRISSAVYDLLHPFY